MNVLSVEKQRIIELYSSPYFDERIEAFQTGHNIRQCAELKKTANLYGLNTFVDTVMRYFLKDLTDNDAPIIYNEGVPFLTQKEKAYNLALKTIADPRKLERLLANP